MVMMALSAGLGGMVLARWMVENVSIVQNFQSAVKRLKYCAGVQAHQTSFAFASKALQHGACVLPGFGYNLLCIKTRPDGLTNLPPGKVDAKADAAPVGATNREMRRPSLDTLEGFFYV
jgi:hypothetical protein